MALSLPEFPPFETDDLSTAGPRWKKWICRFEILLLALDIKNTPAEKARKKSLLLHYMGSSCYDVYETIKVDDEDYAAVKTKMAEYFVPKCNADFERMLLREESQADGETIDQYCTRLKRMAITCDYPDADSRDREIKLQMVSGCRSSHLRKKGMTKPMTLEEFMTLGKSMELSAKQAKIIEDRHGHGHTSHRETESVNAVRHVRGQSSGRPSRGRSHSHTHRGQNSQRFTSSGSSCFNCGGSFPHDTECPAKSRKCHKCSVYGHYAKFCKDKQSSYRGGSRGGSRGGTRGASRGKYGRGKHVCSVGTGYTQSRERDSEYVTQNVIPSDTDSDYSLAIRKPSGMNKIPKLTVQVAGTACKMFVDSGTTVNTLDRQTYEHVARNHRYDSGVDLSPPDTELFAYGTTEPLSVLGMFSTCVRSPTSGREQEAKFYVMENAKGCLMTYETGRLLNLVHIVNAVRNPESRECRVNSIVTEFDQLFHGLGKLKDFQLKLNIDDTIAPVKQTHRRVAFGSREKVEKALKQLYDDDICETPKNTPTPWVSPIVVVPKPRDPDSVRICIDMRAANKAIQRVKHPMPTVHELIHDLNGCKVFTKLDLNQGYHQIELHPDSRYITTFSSHVGLHRYKRLNFGVNAASEKFQQIIEQVLEGLDGVRNISDDIVIGSANDRDHDKQVRACLRRLSQRGLTLNKAKCTFFQSSIEFFGHVFGEQGMSPDPKKVRSVHDAPRPEDKHQVKSLLGMANYVQRYIPGLATMVKPLRENTQKDKVFDWTPECEAAWIRLKDSLTSDTVMSYYDPNLPTELVVDASPCGLGAILTQIHTSHGDRHVKIVSYASRALDDVESRYSQTEREALAVRWGIEHFHLYVFDKIFTVVTDHKASKILSSHSKLTYTILLVAPSAFNIRNSCMGKC